MINSEWSLIIFTLFVQFAVGGFIITGILEKFFFANTDDERIRGFVHRSLLILGGFIVIAVLISFLHLGKPVNAIYVMNNLAASWLSREILLVSLFALLGGVFYLLHRKAFGGQKVRDIIAVITSVTGILAVFAMSKVYMLETVPVWDSFSTPVQFFSSSFILGSFGLLLLFTGKGETHLNVLDTSKEHRIKNFLISIGVLFLIVSFILWLSNVYSLSNTIPSERASIELLFSEYQLIFYLRVVLIVISIILFTLYFIKTELKSSISFVTLILIIVIITEFSGRFLFYSSFSRIGI